MGAFFRSSFTHVDNLITKRCSKQSHGCSCQGSKATNHTGTLRNLPIPPSGTYTNTLMVGNMGAFFLAQWFCPCGQSYHQKVFKTITWLPLSRLQGNKPHRNSPEPSELCLRNLFWHVPELSGTLRNLPAFACGTYTSTQRNPPKPASGTFRNPVPEPPPATRTGTHRSLSGLKTPLAYAVGELTKHN